MATPSGPSQPTATFGARIAAYLIDSIVLLVVLLIFFVIGRRLAPASPRT